MSETKPCRCCYLAIPADSAPYCAECSTCEGCGMPIEYTGHKQRFCNAACRLRAKKRAAGIIPPINFT